MLQDPEYQTRADTAFSAFRTLVRVTWFAPSGAKQTCCHCAYFGVRATEEPRVERFRGLLFARGEIHPAKPTRSSGRAWLQTPGLRPEKGEVLLRGVGALRYSFPPNASVQWQPGDLTIHTKKWFLGAGFLGAPPISLMRRPAGRGRGRPGALGAAALRHRRLGKPPVYVMLCYTTLTHNMLCHVVLYYSI